MLTTKGIIKDIVFPVTPHKIVEDDTSATIKLDDGRLNRSVQLENGNVEYQLSMTNQYFYIDLQLENSN